MTRFDVVIYGATGVTGGKIFETLVRCAKFEQFTVAVAGRNERKLRDVVDNVQKLTNKSLSSPVGILICDATDPSSMAEMARRARLVINAVGPFRIHGEAVVKACVLNGAHQIDVAGEPEWIERMEQKYQDAALQNNVLIVSACGWDSIPADFGVALVKKHFDGELARIEAFVQLHFGPAGYSFSATSLHALLLGFNGAAVHSDLGAVRRQIMPRKIEWSRDDHLPKRASLWWIEEPESRGWALPFVGADKSIVTRSQYYEQVKSGKKAVKFSPYLRFETRWNAWKMVAGGALLQTASKYEGVRSFVMNHPGLATNNFFTEEGPTEEQMQQASFTYRFYGYGYGRGDPRDQVPRRKILVTCTGPDLGYIGTSGCVLSSALVILKERERLPESGGVYTTAAAFGKSRILDHLADFGVKFEIEFPQIAAKL